MTHIELSVPIGTLDAAFEVDVDRLLAGVFGWSGSTGVDEVPGTGPSRARTYVMSDQVRLVLREQAVAMTSGTEDHVGLRVAGDELERLAAGVLKLAREEGRVEFRHLDQGRPLEVRAGGGVFRTFFVRFRLPIWLQFESYEQPH